MNKMIAHSNNEYSMKDVKNQSYYCSCDTMGSRIEFFLFGLKEIIKQL